MNKNTIEITWGTLWKIFFFLIFVSIVFLSKEIFVGVFLALVISSGLESIVNFLERRGLPRTLGVILLFLTAILLLIVVTYAIVPFVIIDVNNALASFRESDTFLGLGSFINFGAIDSANELIAKISTTLFAGGASPLGAFSQFLGGVSLVISIFIISFYLSVTRDGVERFIRAVFPPDYEETVLTVYERSRKKIGFWFRTQILLSFIVGILVWLALALLGIKHAFLLGAMAAVFEIVPFVGPILAGGAAVISALTISAPLALVTLIVFLGIQQLESHFLVPVLMRRSVGLHPVIVIAALLIGIEVYGLLGALVAVPAAAVIQEIVEEWPAKKKARAAA